MPCKRRLRSAPGGADCEGRRRDSDRGSRCRLPRPVTRAVAARQNPSADADIGAVHPGRRHNIVMAEKVIPLADHRTLAAPPIVPPTLVTPSGRVLDTLGRPLRDLRISVTD